MGRLAQAHNRGSTDDLPQGLEVIERSLRINRLEWDGVLRNPGLNRIQPGRWCRLTASYQGCTHQNKQAEECHCPWKHLLQQT
jgi:hypothetical protein